MLSETLRLEDLPEALMRLANPHVRGKIVAEILGARKESLKMRCPVSQPA